ncbi:MAG TPA: outer membrane beta-barrel protein [bacterium]|nr:outer membrane beta-barrel protein [bacterium]
MRKLLFTMIVVFGLVVSVAAQNTVIDSKGALGLQFSIGGNGNLGLGGTVVALPTNSYYGIGGRYFVADKFGLGLALYIAGDDTSATDTQNFLFGIRPNLSYTLVKKGPVALYTGGYLGLGIHNRAVVGTSTSTNVFDIGGQLGAEWAIAPQVSIAAEYAIGVTFDDGDTYWGGGNTRACLTFYF